MPSHAFVKLFVSLVKNEMTPMTMIETRAISFPAVNMSWTFIESFVDMQLIAVRRHKQVAARSLTMSCGMSHMGKNGLAAYSANVSATIACELMDENYDNHDTFKAVANCFDPRQIFVKPVSIDSLAK